MISTRSLSIWLPLICGIVSMVSCKSASVDLRFLPENGARYELAVDISGNGSKTGQTESYALVTNWDLDIRKDSNHSYIKATYKRFKADLLFGGDRKDTVHIDTDHPVPDSIVNTDSNKYLFPWVWQRVKGLQFTFRMNSLGKIDSIQPFTSLLLGLVENVLHRPMGSGEDAQGDRVWNAGAAQFNEKAVKDQLMGLFPEYPGRTLKVGDTLSRSYIDASGLPLIVVQLFKVSEITDSQVTLMLGGSGLLNQTDISVKVEQQGKIVVNRQTGVMETAYIEEILNGTLEKQPFKQSTIMKASCRKLN